MSTAAGPGSAARRVWGQSWQNGQRPLFALAASPRYGSSAWAEVTKHAPAKRRGAAALGERSRPAWLALVA